MMKYLPKMIWFIFGVLASSKSFASALPMQEAIEDENEISCYDVKIRAKPVAQIPSAYPNDPEYIVISWPWFLDLKVKRVIEGSLKETKITALAVLHTRYTNKTKTWLLRHNSIGTFNVIRYDKISSIPRCAYGLKPQQAYLRPAEGKSLEDYRREGEALYRYENDDE